VVGHQKTGTRVAALLPSNTSPSIKLGRIDQQTQIANPFVEPAVAADLHGADKSLPMHRIPTSAGGEDLQWSGIRRSLNVNPTDVSIIRRQLEQDKLLFSTRAFKM